ncbi:NlpC/P60 family protein [Campylobacter majalis]|uniref:NlpC/P60 family protein n=1 Tax=Campylobacter majalis TaxID=2790656 RepID=UPI003D689922
MKGKILLTLLIGSFFTGCFHKTHEISNKQQQYGVDFGRDFGEIAPEPVRPNQTYTNDTQDSKLISQFAVFDRYIGKKTGKDCSGFILHVNKELDGKILNVNEIVKYYDKSGRRSKAMFNMFKKSNKLIMTNTASVGDLVFFANTLGSGVKKNKDKENITHVGIVTKVNKNGSIEFLHNADGKVKKGHMDLNQKNTHKKGNLIINHYIVRCKKGMSHCLASHRFAGFGKTEIR